MVSLLSRSNISEVQKKSRFVCDMVLKFHMSKSTVLFKIVLKKLIDNYQRIKDSSLSLHYFKTNLKLSGKH